MTFALYDAATDGSMVWGPENHAAVPVSDGLFNVGLGSQTSGGIPTTTWNGDRYLEIAVGGETLSPRELIRSVPIAGMALTVSDQSISTSKLNLEKGSACLTNNPDTALSSTHVDIPGLSVQFTLAQPAVVLVWLDGIAHLNSGSSAGIYLKAVSSSDSNRGAGIFVYDNQYWSPIKGQQMFQLASGTYTLKAYAYTEGQDASLKVQGGDPKYRTCINYLVLGEQ
ncbi:MAG: hypothetical protein U9R15_13980 [Chloroflexota bacterium]|nr:hypothetical protein [Chloroflexota bacterium]